MNKKEWTIEQERLLVTWAEKSSGYAWLHNKSVNYYKKRNLCISIPSAIFGYIAGTTTFLASGFDDPLTKGVIGVCAILSGILSNFQEMFPFKEHSEKHKISSLRFLSFFRDISCELSIHSKHRTTPIDYITLKRLEFDKLLEQSPTIPESIIKSFNEKFKHITRIHKPDVVNNLQTIIPYGRGKIMTPKHNLKEKILIAKYFTKLKKYSRKMRIFREKRSNNDVTIEVANSENGSYIDDTISTDGNDGNDDTSNKTAMIKELLQYDNNTKIEKDIDNISISTV